MEGCGLCEGIGMVAWVFLAKPGWIIRHMGAGNNWDAFCL
jgi:hypothetical protein